MPLIESSLQYSVPVHYRTFHCMQCTAYISVYMYHVPSSVFLNMVGVAGEAELLERLRDSDNEPMHIELHTMLNLLSIPRGTLGGCRLGGVYN